MKISDRLSLSFRNLLRRKSRTILTILSVLIGTVSIIMLLTLAIAMDKEQKDMIESFGGIENIEVTSSGMGNKINKSTFSKLKKINHVKYVIPYKDFYFDIKLKSDNKARLQANSGIKLIPDDIFKKIKPDMIEQGRALNSSDDLSMLIGSDVKISKFKKMGQYYQKVPVDKLEPLSQKYKLTLGYRGEALPSPSINNGSKPQNIDVDIKLVGILNDKSFLDKNTVYINEKTFKSLEKEDQKLELKSLDSDNGQRNNKELFTSVSLVCDKYENVSSVEDEVKSMGYETSSSIQMIEDINKASKNIMLILGGIGSIAFFVSAIGIINTMLMSIYERQKEIGVMKVIGASVSDIKSMFLIEAGFIGFFGGLLGLLTSLLITLIINHFIGNMADPSGENFKLLIPIWLAILGVSFSSLVGILAGYLPAIKATKLSAIETLRSN
ncbi:ABC transporter permease [Anaerococcus sp. AGMB00486]|uniref:ABC transporter permease n=1 Tax=Anaerococcus faecalis TaxID=2742993 RepID=A0ABX2N945_9FIRM|nr:ABC transporter permease [Anaerococcus faecalis]NVF11226.1 ABC transporter permease [Anaerococcus faecalis]